MDPSSGIPRPTSRLPVLRPATSQTQLRSPSTEQRKKPSLPGVSPVSPGSRPAQQPVLQKKPSLSSIARVGQPPLQKKPSLSSVSRASQPPLQKKPAFSSVARPSQQPTLQKKPSLSSVSRISQPAPPTLQKKPSRTSLARSSIVPPAPVNTSSNGASVLSTKRSIPSLAARISIADPSVFKKPTGPPSRQIRASVQPPKSSNTSHDDDVLGDLDAFHSASRASSRTSSRAGFHDAEPQHALDIEEDAHRPAARKSRPSLSDRTIESLSQLPDSPGTAKGRRRSSFFSNGEPMAMGPPPRPGSALANGRRPTTSDGTPRAGPAAPQRGALASQQGTIPARILQSPH